MIFTALREKIRTASIGDTSAGELPTSTFSGGLWKSCG